MKKSMHEIWNEDYPNETKCPLAVAFQVEKENSKIENVILCLIVNDYKSVRCFGCCNNHKILKEHFEMKQNEVKP